tara:strand:+ start:2298 stop:3647 length:1350 start_codon:yes stop_codon:yes gene_type:complete
MYDPNNPFAKFNTSPMSLLNVGGFQNPLQPQPIQQNFVNPQAVQQDVQNLEAQAEAQDKLKKRQRGALLLGALSDVLRGQDPTAGVLQKRQFFQQQTAKEEEKQRQERIKQFVQQNPKYAQMYELFGEKGVQSSYLSQLEDDKTDMTEFERTQIKYNELMEIPIEVRSGEDKRNIAILENKLFGQPRVIPFYDSEGNVVESITSRDLISNPNIIKEKEEQGLFTVGQSPSTKPTGAKSVITLVRDNYLGAKSQIDTINDLASIVEQNKDAFTLAGGLANLLNSAKYQVKSAERLANLNKLQQNEKEFTELDNMLDLKYGDILDKISQDRAVAKSIFLRLAYGTAKEIDPSGRLSDNDVKIAMDIIGNLGPNWKANLATLENLANRTQREYDDKYKVRIGSVGDEDLEEANKYKNIPQFLGGRDWRQTTPTETEAKPINQADKILKDLGF